MRNSALPKYYSKRHSLIGWSNWWMPHHLEWKRNWDNVFSSSPISKSLDRNYILNNKYGSRNINYHTTANLKEKKKITCGSPWRGTPKFIMGMILILDIKKKKRKSVIKTWFPISNANSLKGNRWLSGVRTRITRNKIFSTPNHAHSKNKNNNHNSHGMLNLMSISFKKDEQYNKKNE